MDEKEKDGVVVPVALTDEQILGLLAKAADELDATRVHEMRNGKWHATTIFDGDTAALRFARMVLDAQATAAPSHPQEKDTGRYRWLRETVRDDERLRLLERINRAPKTPEEFDAAIDRAIKESGYQELVKQAASDPGYGGPDY